MTQDLIDQFIAEVKRAGTAHPHASASASAIAHAVTYALNQQAMDRRAAKVEPKVDPAALRSGTVQYGSSIAFNERPVKAPMSDRDARWGRAKEYIKRNGEQGYATALDMVIFAEREIELKQQSDLLAQGRDFL